jgi:hypothetical protein
VPLTVPARPRYTSLDVPIVPFATHMPALSENLVSAAAPASAMYSVSSPGTPSRLAKKNW